MNLPATNAPGLVWPVTLAAAAIAGSLATACMMPFVAVATLAALTMSRGSAAIAVLGAWAVNQLLGFGLLGYPHSIDAVGWGAAIAGAAVGALFAARAIGGRLGGAAGWVAAFAVAFATYELLLFVVALFAGGLGTFAPAIVARILANDAIWFVALGALYLMLTRAAPRWFVATPLPQRG